MIMPGWYPDPDPQRSGGFRYWDGRTWTDRTVDDDAADGKSAGRRRGWPWVLVAAVALVVVLALAAGWVLLRRGEVAGPGSTVSGGDDRSPLPTAAPSPTATPAPSPSGVRGAAAVPGRSARSAHAAFGAASPTATTAVCRPCGSPRSSRGRPRWRSVC